MLIYIGWHFAMSNLPVYLPASILTVILQVKLGQGYLTGLLAPAASHSQLEAWLKWHC